VNPQPILIFAYNRIDTLEKIFESLPLHDGREVTISIDGQKYDGMTENGAKVRELSRNLSDKFPNQVKIIDRVSNLGLQVHCVLAMTEFFNEVESGIVLDDDIVPDRKFYEYMDFYLDRFDGNGEIKVVNGWTPLYVHETKGRCHVTKYFVSWGWGTWATVFNQIEFGLVNYKPGSRWWSEGTISNVSKSFGFRAFWSKRFIRIHSSVKDRSWDWEMLFELWRLNGKALSPSERMVSNLGYDEFAFHPNSGSKRQRALVRNLDSREFVYEIKVFNSKRMEKKYERKMWDLGYQRILSAMNYRLNLLVSNVNRRR
jgi:hypothetical protein